MSNEQVTLTKPPKTFQYEEPTQDKIVAMMLAKPDILGDDYGEVRSEFFTNPLNQDIVGVAVKHFKRYHRAPAVDEVWEGMNKFLREESKSADAQVAYQQHFSALLDIAGQEEHDFAWLRDQVFETLNASAMRMGQVKAAEATLRGEPPSKVVEIIIRAAQVCSTTYRPLHSADEIVAKERAWFWQGRIPSERMFMFVGPPQSGKSYFSMYMASKVAPLPDTPTDWPDPDPDQTGPGLTGPPQGRVLVFNNEDDWETDIAPRLDKLGCDRSRVLFDAGSMIETGDLHLFDFVKNLPLIERWLREYKDIRFINFDPMLDFVGDKLNRNQEQEVRVVLTALRQLAKKYQVTIGCNAHLNKSTLQESWARTAGALSWFSIPRCVMLATSDLEMPDIKYFTQWKANFGKHKPGLCFDVNDETGRIEFHPDRPCPSVEDLLSSGPRKRDPDQVIEIVKRWCVKLLANGPVRSSYWAGKEKADGINHVTLQKAKDELGIESWTVGSPAHDGYWMVGYAKDNLENATDAPRA